MEHSSYKYKDINEFLAKHSVKKDDANISPTHTRIGDKSMNIYGGKYVIPKEELPLFYELYYDAIFEKKNFEYLTEKQLKKNSPILIDLDFRYNYDVVERQHTKEHVQDLINLIYLEELKEFFVFEKNKPFPIFVMEKPNVNRLEDGSLTKDGIHIIIGIQMEHTMQIMLREKVVNKIHEIWDLPLINNWDSVLDEGITKGTTNWQLFGSRKPGFQAYELTQYYEISYDETDGEFCMIEKKVSDFNLSKNFNKLSAQYDEHPAFEINPKMKNEYEERLSNNKKSTRPKKSNSKTKLRLLIDDEDEMDDNEISLDSIVNAETLKKAVDNMLKNLKEKEYEIREIHEFTQILPEKYYEPGSHSRNTQVAFALKHTHDCLFLSWVMLRSKASDFDYNSIPDLWMRWKKHFKEKPDGVSITKRSIIYWAKQDAPEEYLKVKKNTVNHFVDESLASPSDWDFAMVLYQMFKDKYVCTSIVNKTWSVFSDHRWVPDKGQSLRMAISKEMYNVYQDKLDTYFKELLHYAPGEDLYIETNKKIKYITEQTVKLKKTTEKNNIMREAAEIFFDSLFIKNMDSNKHLLCFSNGVVDFKNKIFRDGYPQDYITKSTNIPYVPFDPVELKEEADYLLSFMEQLFPVESLCKYMWDHLASTLIGDNINQTFNIYRGSGSNGKSIFTDLMGHTLGEYKGMVPITLVSDKRNSIGGTSSEIMQLKGIRYAVMQEPSKGIKMNEGVMKELTGGDPIQARALYCESETFTLQCNLVVCTNILFDVDSNDDGTWRRIRICDFMSKFVDENDASTLNDTEHPYKFTKDKLLKYKLPKLAKTFASMLVKRAFETEGLVTDCDIVMASSNKYRQGQDHISAFVGEMVVKKEGKKIKRSELCEQFKLWFQEQQGGRKAPKGVELCEYMDKKFGKGKKDGWANVEIVYPENENEIDELN